MLRRLPSILLRNSFIISALLHHSIQHDQNFLTRSKGTRTRTISHALFLHLGNALCRPTRCGLLAKVGKVHVHHLIKIFLSHAIILLHHRRQVEFAHHSVRPFAAIIPLEMRLIGERLPIATPSEAYLLTNLANAAPEISIVVFMTFDIFANIKSQANLVPMETWDGSLSIAVLAKLGLVFSIPHSLRDKHGIASRLTPLNKDAAVNGNIRAQLVNISTVQHIQSSLNDRLSQRHHVLNPILARHFLDKGYGDFLFVLGAFLESVCGSVYACVSPCKAA
nr:MAG TPA: hypothetical protein [Bacteriophage sp.]